MNRVNEIPTSFYGVLKHSPYSNEFECIVEQIRILGYAVLDAGYSADDLERIRHDFDDAHESYVQTYGASRLKEIDEFNTIRCPLSLGFDSLKSLVFNDRLLAVIDQLILGSYTLNQQNGIINPPGQTYNQASWHRDLAYQHFVASRPIAVNALFCVDAFTEENGATFVLPASHKIEEYPSKEFIQNSALQVSAPAGSYILLDCMTFHSGGVNRSGKPRRAVNHLYGIPHLRQQIRIPRLLEADTLTERQRQILGFSYDEADSVSEYLNKRPLKL